MFDYVINNFKKMIIIILVTAGNGRDTVYSILK